MRAVEVASYDVDLKDDEPRYVPRSIYEGARDMARQIAGSREGRTARRPRKKVEMLSPISNAFLSSIDSD